MMSSLLPESMSLNYKMHVSSMATPHFKQTTVVCTEINCYIPHVQGDIESALSGRMRFRDTSQIDQK